MSFIDSIKTNAAPGQDLPPEVQDLIDEIKANQAAKVEAIGKDVAKMRDDAVKGRLVSGIEAIWEEDEEYIQGVDDANRESVRWLKSPSTTGGISAARSTSGNRCTSFFNITRQFVESAAARMGDILLPAGDWNFSIGATPVQDKIPGAAEPAQAPPVMQPAGAGQAPPPAPVDPLIKIQAEADTKAGKAENKIHDWLTECSYHTEVRKVIEDAAGIGTGILKGPFPDRSMVRKTTNTSGVPALELVMQTNPTSKRVDPWDFFPDPGCGESIHDGNYVFERDRLTARQLRNLKGQPGYLDDQIDIVLDEGPNKKNYTDGHKDQEGSTEDKYEVWYFYGLIDVSGLDAMKVNTADSKKKQLPAIVTLVNDTAIRAFLNPLDSGEYPYDVMPWQRCPGTWTGIGIARQGRVPQDMLNAGTRALMDNAGLSSGPMIILRKGAIIPADGRWEITARKVWYATEQADIRSVQDAIFAINIPMVQAELTAIVQLAYKNMEDATGLTYLLQGQQGSAPDTVGGMELLHRNASAILRRLARVFDERVTEPHIRRYYDYLMAYSPDECKGDWKIEAIGSTALVEREIHAMQSMQLLQFSLNPAFGLDPAKAMTEVLKAQRFIPEKWTMDDAKKAQMAQQPQMIPAVEVAKINAAARKEELQANLEEDRWKQKLLTTTSMHKIEVDTDRDRSYNDSMARRDDANAQARQEEWQVKRDLAMLDYANKRNITLDQIKADLAKTAMKLRTQKELAGLDAQLTHDGIDHKAAVEVMTPPTEPPGRAAPGHAFEA